MYQNPSYQLSVYFVTFVGVFLHVVICMLYQFYHSSHFHLHFETICLVSRDNDCSKDIKYTTGKATGAFQGFRKVWPSKEISIHTTTRLLSVCVISVPMYAAET